MATERPDGHRGRGTRLRGAAALAARWLWHYRVRSGLAVAGITVAVVLAITLGSVGHGVTTNGGQAIELINRDLWATTGSVALRPGGVGGVANPVQNAHERTAAFEATEGVSDADALGFNAVYVSDTPSDFETIVGVGVTGSATEANMEAGTAFGTVDLHYGSGDYDGPMTRELLIDRRTAERFDVGVGDELYIGGTIATAEQQSFEVVGITSTFSRFLGAPTVTLHLSELQTVVGTTGTDPAAVIAITTPQDTSTDRVQRRLEQRFPEFSVRTNDEQVRAITGRQSTLLVAAGLLVLLAIVTSILLTANVAALLVQQQRESLAVALATGMRPSTLAVAVVVQGAFLGLSGAVLGCLLALPMIAGVNAVVGTLTGFGDLLLAPPWLYLLGGTLAVGFGVGGSLAGAYLVVRLDPVRVLSRH